MPSSIAATQDAHKSCKGLARLATMSEAAIRIDVCICAFARRAGLRHCLQSLAAQVDAPAFRVLIADNHAQLVVPDWIDADSGTWPFELRVLHAPQANIAVARNALLEAVSSEWIAFIDDDEIAAPDWLASLYAARDTGDVVFGPVQARYPAAAPEWLRRGDFLSKRPARRARGYDTGHSANVLIRRECIGALRFEVELGRTGGEDTLFFASMHDAGARLLFRDRAVVFEPADPARSGFATLMARSVASGHAHARVQRMRGQGRAYIAIVAAAKCVASLCFVVLQAMSPVGWRRQCLRAALHFGVAAHALGALPPTLYGDATVRVDA